MLDLATIDAALDGQPLRQGERMTTAQIAELFDEPIATIDSWVRKGCPHERTGGVRSPRMFWSADVYWWQLEYAVREKKGAAESIRMQRVVELARIESSKSLRMSE